MKRLYTQLLTLLCLLTVAVQADNKPMKIEHKIGGTVQSFYSLQSTDEVNSGFGLRRVRVRWLANIDGKLRTFIQSDLTSNSLAGALVDARIEYHFSDQFNIRVGRFVGAGVRGGALTSHTDIDIVERSYSANQWALKTIGGDFRDFGLQLEAKSSNKMITGRLWLHNGSGSLNIRNTEAGYNQDKFAASAVDAMLIIQPQNIDNLEIGGHFGIGNSDIKKLNSFSAYAYYTPGPLHLKTELILLTDKPGAVGGTSLGYYLFGGYDATEHIQLVARWEPYDPNTDQENDKLTFMTLGIVFKEYSGKVNHKLTAAVVLPSEQGHSIDNTTAYALWQIVF
jgi:hypothetical protein